VSDNSLQPGDLVAGRFRLDRVLGAGGMGTVWAATHAVTGRAFALKVLVERRARDDSAKKRLLREAKAACATKHPAILPIDDVIELEDGSHALVMDLLSGESLRARLEREGRIAPATVRALFAPVVEALEAAHAAGVVHRDLKPDNLFVVDGKEMRILDFGVAKVETEDAPGLTSTGAMLGTPYYMAPEQAFGEDCIDAQADVWSLGVVLFECLSGTRPTQGANLGQVLKLMNSGTLPRLQSLAPETPPALAEVVDRMLSKERAARPSLREVEEALLAPDDTVIRGVASSLPEPAAAPAASRRMLWAIAPVVLLLAGGGYLASLRATGSAVSGAAASPSASSLAPASPLPPSSLEAPVAATPSSSVRATATPAPTAPNAAAPGLRRLAVVDPAPKPVAEPPDAGHHPAIVDKPPF
jgi:eukaryotic-like serine/threonine-protein kinase